MVGNRHAAFFISCCNTVFYKRPSFGLQKTAFYDAKDGLLHGERPSFIFTPMTDLSVALVLVFLRDVLVLVDFSQRYRPNDVVLLYRA